MTTYNQFRLSIFMYYNKNMIQIWNVRKRFKASTGQVAIHAIVAILSVLVCNMNTFLITNTYDELVACAVLRRCFRKSKYIV